MKKVHEINTAKGITYCGLKITEKVTVASSDEEWIKAEDEDQCCKKCELLTEPSYRE